VIVLQIGVAQPTTTRRIMKSIPSTDLRRLTTAEFARMSRSLQLTLLIIRRAQLASRKVIAATPNWRAYGKTHSRDVRST